MKISSLIFATVASVLVIDILSLGFVLVPVLLTGGDAPMYLNQIVFYGFWVTVITTMIVIVVGIPIYLLLHHYKKATKLNLGIAGFVIPVAIFSAINFVSGSSWGYSTTYHGTYRHMIIEGERTIWGWISLVEQGLIFGLYGVIAAFIFALTAERFSSISNRSLTKQ